MNPPTFRPDIPCATAPDPDMWHREDTHPAAARACRECPEQRKCWDYAANRPDRVSGTYAGAWIPSPYRKSDWPPALETGDRHIIRAMHATRTPPADIAYYTRRPLAQILDVLDQH